MSFVDAAIKSKLLLKTKVAILFLEIQFIILVSHPFLIATVLEKDADSTKNATVQLYHVPGIFSGT